MSNRDYNTYFSIPIDRCYDESQCDMKVKALKLMCCVCQNIPVKLYRDKSNPNNVYCQYCAKIKELKYRKRATPEEVLYMEKFSIKCINKCGRRFLFNSVNLLVAHELECSQKKIGKLNEFLNIQSQGTLLSKLKGFNSEKLDVDSIFLKNQKSDDLNYDQRLKELEKNYTKLIKRVELFEKKTEENKENSDKSELNYNKNIIALSNEIEKIKQESNFSKNSKENFVKLIQELKTSSNRTFKELEFNHRDLNIETKKKFENLRNELDCIKQEKGFIMNPIDNKIETQLQEIISRHENLKKQIECINIAYDKRLKELEERVKNDREIATKKIKEESKNENENLVKKIEKNMLEYTKTVQSLDVKFRLLDINDKIQRSASRNDFPSHMNDLISHCSFNDNKLEKSYQEIQKKFVIVDNVKMNDISDLNNLDQEKFKTESLRMRGNHLE